MPRYRPASIVKIHRLVGHAGNTPPSSYPNPKVRSYGYRHGIAHLCLGPDTMTAAMKLTSFDYLFGRLEFLGAGGVRGIATDLLLVGFFVPEHAHIGTWRAFVHHTAHLMAKGGSIGLLQLALDHGDSSVVTRAAEAWVERAGANVPLYFCRPSRTVTPRTTQRIRTMEGHGGLVSSIALLPDGRRAITASHDGTLRVWHLILGACICVLGSEGPRASAAYCLPDGQHVVACYESGRARVWDLGSGTVVREHQFYNDRLYCMTNTDEGCTILLAGQRGNVHVWRPWSDEVPRSIQGMNDRIQSLTVDGDTRIAYSGGFSGSIARWSLVDERYIDSLKAHERPIMTVLVDPSRRRLFSAGWDAEIHVRAIADLSMNRILDASEHRSTINHMALSPDGVLLASGSADQSILVWDAESLTVVRRVDGNGASVTSVAFSEKGSSIFAAAGGSLREWRIDTEDDTPNEERHQGFVTGFAVLKDRLASVGQDGVVRYWDTTTGAPIAGHHVHIGEIASVDTDVLPGHLVTSGGDGRVYRVDAEGTKWGTLKVKRAILARIPGESRVIGGDVDGNLFIADMATGNVEPFARLSRRLTSIVVSPDGARAFFAFGEGVEKVYVWDTMKRERIGTLDGHTEGVWRVALSSDGARLVSASDDNSVRVWDTTTHQCVQTMVGHQSWVNGAALDAHGERAVSAGSDGTLFLWDVASGGVLGRWDGENAFTCCGFFTTNTIFAGDEGGLVTVLRWVEKA